MKHNISESSKKLIVIACSTGGPKALDAILPSLPEDFPYSVLIVQHMPVGFTFSLANRLDVLSQVKVKEAKDHEQLKDNMIYIAKGGSQMQIRNKGQSFKIVLTDEAGINGLKPCADILLESLIDTSFQKIICVVLTGMGSDGKLGLKKLKKKKDVYVIAQDEETCTVFGMPKAVIDYGLADEVVPLESVAASIIRNLEE